LSKLYVEFSGNCWKLFFSCVSHTNIFYLFLFPVRIESMVSDGLIRCFVNGFVQTITVIAPVETKVSD